MKERQFLGKPRYGCGDYVKMGLEKIKRGSHGLDRCVSGLEQVGERIINTLCGQKCRVFELNFALTIITSRP